MKTIIVRNETMPTFLPQGWKKKVAEHIGIHQKSLPRILRSKAQPNYGKIIESVKNLYGIELK